MSPAWEEALNILVVRLDGAGDVLMSTPAIRAMRESVSGRRITLLTSPAGAAVARLVPEVDRVIEYVAPWMKPAANPEPRPHLEMIGRLRAERFDAAAILTVYSQSALPAATLCTLAGIPLRLAHSREKPYGLLTDWVPEREPEQFVRHEVQRQLDLVAAVGARSDEEGLSLAVPHAARERVAALLAEVGVQGGRWCVMHPGATAESRRYPATAFAEVARLLGQEHGWQTLVVGSHDETSLAAAVTAGAGDGAVDLGGRLPLEELAALIEASPVLVCNNSLAAHLGAAVGTPVVDLYALTNPQHTPWMTRSRVLFRDVPCRYCYSSKCPQGHLDCLRLVTPREVVDAAVGLVRGEPPVEVDVLPPLVRG